MYYSNSLYLNILPAYSATTQLARVVCRTSKTFLILDWLRVRKWIDYKVALLTLHCSFVSLLTRVIIQLNWHFKYRITN